MMWEIYTEAVGVLACVGRLKDNSELLPNLSRLLGLEPTLRWDLREIVASDADHPVWKPINETIHDARKLADICLAVYHFACRSYWTRLWILQEFVAGRNHTGDCQIFLGEDMLAWSSVEVLWRLSELSLGFPKVRKVLEHRDGKVFKIVHGLTDSRGPFASPLLRMKYTTSFGPLEFSEVFEYFGSFQCTNPLDKVYGLLHLIDWSEDEEPITPDYQRSTLALALELCPRLRLDQVFTMMQGIRINCRHTGFQQIIATRVKDRFSKSSIVASQKHNYTAINSSLAAFIEDPGTARGRFTIPTSSLVITPADGKSRASTKHVTLSIDVSSVEWQFRSPKVMLSDGKAVALLCNEARTGDIMSKVVMNHPVLIILRPVAGNLCDVVGQGIELEAFESLCDTQKSCGLWDTRFGDQNLLFQADLTAEDKLVLAGQGILDGEDRSLYSVEAFALRLLTMPLEFPERSVRLDTIRRHDDDYEVVEAECGTLFERSSGLRCPPAPV